MNETIYLCYGGPLDGGMLMLEDGKKGVCITSEITGSLHLYDLTTNGTLKYRGAFSASMEGRA